MFKRLILVGVLFVVAVNLFAAEKDDIAKIKALIQTRSEALNSGSFADYLSLIKGNRASLGENSLIFWSTQTFLQFRKKLKSQNLWAKYISTQKGKNSLNYYQNFSTEDVGKISKINDYKYQINLKNKQLKRSIIDIIKIDEKFYFNDKSFKKDPNDIIFLAWKIDLENQLKMLQPTPNFKNITDIQSSMVQNPYNSEAIMRKFANTTYFIENNNTVKVTGTNQQAFVQRFSFVVSFSKVLDKNINLQMLKANVFTFENDFYREQFKDFSFNITLNSNNNIDKVKLNNNLSRSQLLAIETLLEECFFPLPNRQLCAGEFWNTENFKTKCKFYRRGFDNYLIETFYFCNSDKMALINAHEMKIAVQDELKKIFSSEQRISLNLAKKRIGRSDSYININTIKPSQRIIMNQHIKIQLLPNSKKLQKVIKNYLSD